jgi:predicted RNA-binding protein with PIN domain
MNVIGSRPDGWWKDRHGAMVRLVGQLDRWAATGDEDITVVFERPPSPPISSTAIGIAYAPRGRPNSADDEITRILAEDREPGEIRVVTSDRRLADRARKAGATVVSAASFRGELERS